VARIFVALVCVPFWVDFGTAVESFERNLRLTFTSSGRRFRSFILVYKRQRVVDRTTYDGTSLNGLLCTCALVPIPAGIPGTPWQAGMKTDRIGTDMTDIIFVFIFMSGFGFEYR
jgi:hypothetical protein